MVGLDEGPSCMVDAFHDDTLQVVYEDVILLCKRHGDAVCGCWQVGQLSSSVRWAYCFLALFLVY